LFVLFRMVRSHQRGAQAPVLNPEQRAKAKSLLQEPKSPT